MTTATTTVEELLRQAIDRIARQERRVEALEASVRGAPVAPAVRSSSAETPVEVRWPTREVPAAPPAADRVRELEARLAQAEERLKAAARLEAVGRLVAGVAHDFNNLLTVITGSAETIRGQLPAGHYLREAADLIAGTAQTAAGVTRQLVAFGRPGKPEPCPVDVNLSVRGIEPTLRRLTGERVALEFHPAEGLPLVRADPGQFDQVLLNLIVNARDAIPGDGTITVRTAADVVAPDRPGWPAGVPGGEFVAVTVADTGTGMSEEVLAKVFDLFFTTKGAGGTGVGLSTVRDIARGAGGHVEVESAVGWGTSVRVFWPVLREPAGRPLRVAR